MILYWVTSPEEKPERACRRLDLHQLQRVGHPNYLLVCKHWFDTAYFATWREVVLKGPAHGIDQQLRKVREHKQKAEKRLASGPFRTNDVLLAWDGRVGDTDIAVLRNLHNDLLVRPESLVINLKRASASTPLYPPVLGHPTFHCLTRLHIESNKHLVVQDISPRTKLRCNLVSFYISAYRDTQTNKELIRAAFASSAESLLEVGIGYSNDRHPDAVVLRDCLVRAKRVEKVAFRSEVLPPVLAILPTLPALATLELNGYAKIEEIERFCAPQSTLPTLESLTVRPFAGDIGHPAGGGRRINKDRYGTHVDPERRMLGHLARSIETGGNLGALKKLKLLSDEELDLATGDGKYLMDMCKTKEIKVTERVWNCFEHTSS
ncbi:hypothetical protein RQP46_007458 [Phenoliferia psychrophenolica]